MEHPFSAAHSTISAASIPVVYHDPYQYGSEGSTGDYVMQNVT